MTLSELDFSQRIENILVAKNLRGMATAQQFLTPGYYLRAAKQVFERKGVVFIGTGFPVTDTFETDGPVGAIALFQILEELGYEPYLLCGAPLYQALATNYRSLELPLASTEHCEDYAKQILAQYQPSLVISIERPGKTSDGTYRNMRGEDISSRCAQFDPFVAMADCPTIAIGDGGNEIGMGNIAEQLTELDIMTSVTTCDELLIADVSNWAAYGIIAFLSRWHHRDLLVKVDPQQILHFLSARGSVDGVTRENTLTEDSLCFSAGENIIQQLRELGGWCKAFE